MKITSTWRYGYDWRISYRYYLDGNDIWFNFNDICEFLNIYSNRFINNYFNKLPNYNKRIIEDDNNTNNRLERSLFVNKAVFDEIVAHEINRSDMLKQDIKILESELGLTNHGSGYDCRNLMNNLIFELSKENSDINKVREYCKGFINTPEIQEFINNKHPLEEKEKLQPYKDWLESDEEMFIAHKDNDNIYIWQGPSMDEALDILFNAGLED